jgi:hypothetical protein
MTTEHSKKQVPYGWKIQGVSRLVIGEYAEVDAKAEAKRIGGTCEAFPLYTAPLPVDEPVLQNIEQYRLQMAGISAAALGYWKEGDSIHPDYDTPALREVAELYAKYIELYKAQPPREWVGLTESETIAAANNANNYIECVRMTAAKLKEKNT